MSIKAIKYGFYLFRQGFFVDLFITLFYAEPYKIRGILKFKRYAVLRKTRFQRTLFFAKIGVRV